MKAGGKRWLIRRPLKAINILRYSEFRGVSRLSAQMLPNLCNLSLTQTTDAQNKRPREDVRPRKDVEEEEAIRQLLVSGPDDVQTKCDNDRPNTLSSLSNDDLGALAVVLYSNYWDSVMNRYLAAKDQYAARPSDGGVHNMYSEGKFDEKLKDAFAMFVDVDVLMAHFLNPSEYGAIAGYLSDGGLHVELTVGEACALDATLAPTDPDAKYDVDQMSRTLSAALSAFSKRFFENDPLALQLYDSVVKAMITTLDDMWRPWLAFYEPETTVQDKKRRLRAIVTRGDENTTGGQIAARLAFKPTTPTGSWLSWLLGKAATPPPQNAYTPCTVVPKPTPKPPGVRIVDKIPTDYRSCAETGAVIWVGLSTSLETIDFRRLGASMRSATLGLRIALDFAGVGSDGTVLGLLLGPNVPVISVLDALALRGDNFLCYGTECEVLLSHGCTYNLVQGDSLDDQIRQLENDHPEYYASMTSSGVWSDTKELVEEEEEDLKIRFVTVTAPEYDLQWLPDDWRSRS